MGCSGGRTDPIAIIGIGCRFPGGADSPEQLWQLLLNGVDAIREVPPERWDIGAFYDSDPARKARMVTRWGGFVDHGLDELDALFFGISPREAAYLDPMQRWLLEVVWEALEDGGEVPDELAGSDTGVFIGIFTRDMEMLELSPLNRDLLDGYSATGSAMTMAANRISYQFDFRGPSLAIDTACSSSLVATHYACQSLWNGECCRAVVGGANAMFRPEYTIAESKAGMLSPDGRCKAFDDRANGYVRGEGAGAVVLKPLAAALADGNPVYAVILGSAVNQDGKTNGITVPSGEAQVRLVEEACRRAGISPGQIRYVEAHGTGTPVGDPVEANALAAALAIDRPPGERCPIGSIKTNVGHLEAAAGIAGLIKAALCLSKRWIPPHLHLREPNPQIPFDRLSIRVAREPEPLAGGAAYAGVNSFGFGGSNAHVVLGEAPPAPPAPRPTPGADSWRLVPLSARSPQALGALAESYRQRLAGAGDGSAPPLEDVAWSAGVHRGHHPHRLAILARSRDDLADGLAAFRAGEARGGLAHGYSTPGRRPRVVFVFSGMGPQWWAMGRELLAGEPVFRRAVERCDELIGRHAEWSLLEEMSLPEERSRMAETRIAQPASFALQVALYELWRSWGVECDAVVGHSAGEVAAFYAAGVYSLEEAAGVIYHRSRLQHRTTGQGRLVAAGLSLEEAREAIAGREDRISVAAINSPSSVTLVGDPEALAEVVAPLEARKVFCRFLRVAVPYHSHYMDPLRPELLEALGFLAAGPAAKPLYSSTLGRRASHQELDAGYWWRNVREPVFFAAALEEMIDDGYRIFLELAPHPVLGGSISECLAQKGEEGLVLSSLRRGDGERAQLLTALGALYAHGVDVAWRQVQQTGRFVSLPLYPWQRERYWQESEESQEDRFGLSAPRPGGGSAAAGLPSREARTPQHPLLGRRLRAAHPTWEARIDRRSTPYLEDHEIQGALIFPGAAFLEMGVAACRQLEGDAKEVELENVELSKALFLSEDAVATLQLVVDPGSSRIEISSPPRDGRGPWNRHASYELRPGRGLARLEVADLEELRRRCPNEVSAADCYSGFADRGFHYGPTFRALDRLWKGDGEVLASTAVHPAVENELEVYQVHPAILDAGFQALLAVALDAPADDGRTYVPVGGDSFRVLGRPTARMWIHARLLESSAARLRGDLRLLDEDGGVVLELRGFRAVALEGRRGAAEEPLEDLFYAVSWVPAEPLAPAAEAGPGSWILFADRGGTAAALAALLEQRGEACYLVEPGAGYHFSAESCKCRLDPRDGAQIDRLLAAVAAGGERPCRGLVHLWSLDVPDDADLSASALEGFQDLTCGAVVSLVQALDRMRWRQPPRLWAVTRGAQPVAAETTVRAVAQAPLSGLGMTLAHQEHSGTWGGLIDLDGETTAEQDAALLLAELRSGGGPDPVALRGGERWAPRLVRRRELAAGTLEPRFRAHGAYLITGGLGGLGLAVARWMAEQGARHLILLGRRTLPEGWREGAGGEASTAVKIAAVRELEARGATVDAVAVDVADEDRLSEFLAGYRKAGRPPIRGVMHLAGLSQPRLVLNMDAGTFASTLRAKLVGGWLLHRLLAAEPLDFFVLFSSVAALGTSMGQSAYAAGNAFLDALAHHRQALGLPALAIGWGAWADVGMGSEPAVAEDFRRRGIVPMAPRRAIEAMARLFGRRLAHVVVTGGDWLTVAGNNYPMLGFAPPLLSELVGEKEPGELPRPAREAIPAEEILPRLRAAAASERLPLLGEHLHALAAGVLRLSRSQLDREQPLNSLGLDSMVAVELKNRIAASTGADLSIVELLQDSSITRLARRLLPELELPDDGEPVATAESSAEATDRTLADTAVVQG